MKATVSVGDIFMGSGELYRVTHIQQSTHFPDDPYFEVEAWVSGSGWSNDCNMGFLLSSAKSKFKLEFFKATEL